jgi:hypothetical protein
LFNVTVDPKAVIHSGAEQRESTSIRRGYLGIGKARIRVHATTTTLALTVTRNEGPRRAIFHCYADVARIIIGPPNPHLNQFKRGEECVNLRVRSWNPVSYKTLENTISTETDF